MQHVILFMEQFGLLAVFVNVLLAEGGLPLPAYPAIITASAVAAGTGNDLAKLMAVGIAATMIADIVWYRAAGRYGNRVLRQLCRLSLSPDSCVRQTQTMFGRIGPWSLLFVKFVPGLSNVTVALAGITKTRLPLFLALDALGASLFIGVPVLLGRVFKDAIANVLDTLAGFGRMGAVALLVALALFLLNKWWKRHRFIRQLRMDRITVDELRGLIDSDSCPLILDVRDSQARLRDGIIPGALAAHPSELDPLIASSDHDREVVIYCACPNEASAAIAARHLKQAGFKKIRPLLGGIDAWVLAGNSLEALALPAARPGPALERASDAGRDPAAIEIALLPQNPLVADAAFVDA
jgi:membrane protein DedA with SNARE-associated domain/rhodanese-related sulfurtransferase